MKGGRDLSRNKEGKENQRKARMEGIKEGGKERKKEGRKTTPSKKIRNHSTFFVFCVQNIKIIKCIERKDITKQHKSVS
jgi:hypothetical protein